MANGDRIGAPEPIGVHHDVSDFQSGKAPLDEWLRSRARKSEGVSARTVVVCHGPKVIGYYALSTGSERHVSLPGKLRRNMPEPVPLMVLGRLAVDAHFHRRGIGAGLLKDALLRTIQASEIVGMRAVLVHAIDAEAVAFYKKYGFIDFPAGGQTLFLPVEMLKQAL
jgi:GNAT superfamily N-acetyltransferase